MARPHWEVKGQLDLAFYFMLKDMIFSVGCDSRIGHRTKDRKNTIFCVVPDAAVASDTENHGSCKQTIRICYVSFHP
jgi:hypothetical protein